MKITDKDVAYVADLANLELTDAERERMVRDLNSILEYIDRLNELDTTTVVPMSHATMAVAAESQATSGNVLREDELRPCLPHEDAMANAPNTDGHFFKVPKVIEK
jgi:aspartyl-tRNA(Asn)/glutamyl-tRNA(Gln) amidotransferase subunit C